MKNAKKRDKIVVVESIPLTHNDRLNRAANSRPTATCDFAHNRSNKVFLVNIKASISCHP